MENDDREIRQEQHELLNDSDAMEGAVRVAMERLTKLIGCDSVIKQVKQ